MRILYGSCILVMKKKGLKIAKYMSMYGNRDWPATWPVGGPAFGDGLPHLVIVRLQEVGLVLESKVACVFGDAILDLL